ncbi:hypothetical protein [Methylosinus sp. Ce-a6]|uniref:hypothetical protein n=1 Tax=Methylosinus sp. Ce-a6 TaxID=2172005 RepID=UPI001FCE8E03|nr:hypothetical protein [Methylosinus sp. Ce-a6]
MQRHAQPLRAVHFDDGVRLSRGGVDWNVVIIIIIIIIVYQGHRRIFPKSYAKALTQVYWYLADGVAQILRH